MLNKPASKRGNFIFGTSINLTELDRTLAAVVKRIIAGKGLKIRTSNKQIIISRKTNGESTR